MSFPVIHALPMMFPSVLGDDAAVPDSPLAVATAVVRRLGIVYDPPGCLCLDTTVRRAKTPPARTAVKIKF